MAGMVFADLGDPVDYGALAANVLSAAGTSNA